MAQCVIPADILSIIFQAVDYDALLVLMLASRAFRAIAERLLYTAVELHRSRALQDFRKTIALRKYRASFVNHLSVLAQNDWSPASTTTALSSLLDKLVNLKTFTFSHPAVHTLSFRLPPRILSPLKAIEVPHLLLFDRLSTAPSITHLRISDNSYIPSRSAQRSIALLENLSVLSCGLTTGSIIRFASALSRIDCWEFHGDALLLDQLTRSPAIMTALASTRVRCLRFIRRSFACNHDFAPNLFLMLRDVECVEFSTGSGFGRRLYRDKSRHITVPVRWACQVGNEWQHNWERDAEICRL